MIRPLARNAAAIALIVAADQYVVTEAVASSSWKAPRYRYSFNFISDLGVPSCGGEVDGRTVCSPLHAVMNTGFVVQGVLFVVAAVLLFRMVPGRLRWVYPALAVVHGAGITLVGLLHGSPEAAADGSMAWHILGAMMAIFGDNLASIVVSVFPREGADRHHPPPPDQHPRPDRHRRPPHHSPPAPTLALGTRLRRPVDRNRSAHGHLNQPLNLTAHDPKDLGDPARTATRRLALPRTGEVTGKPAEKDHRSSRGGSRVTAQVLDYV